MSHGYPTLGNEKNLGTTINDVLVMYEGKIIETLDSNKILEAKHPYSKKIIESVL